MWMATGNRGYCCRVMLTSRNLYESVESIFNGAGRCDGRFGGSLQTVLEPGGRRTAI